MICRTVHTAWLAVNRGRHRRFLRALGDPESTQMRLLAHVVSDNADSAFGRAHGFDRIGSPREFREHVPISRYDAYADAIDRVRRGDRSVLTREPVSRLVPTGGSSGGRKLIPWTASLSRQFNRAIGPWVCDLYSRHPGLVGGPSYWSISPVFDTGTDEHSVVPIGFDHDASYLGGVMGCVVKLALLAPSGVGGMRDMEAFCRVTLVCLLRARRLRLISVWHPSFLTLLMDAAEKEWDEFAREAGRLDLVGSSGDWRAAWPDLRVVSCWTDAHASDAARHLSSQIRHAVIEPKGLLATEGIVTLPLVGEHPLAIRSHVFEFVDAGGRAWFAHEIVEGGEYEVIITTGGGLYRYALGDSVRVIGRVGRTPSLRFIGRADRVSDRVGEKLNAAHVEAVLNRVIRPRIPRLRFVMLAPDDGPPVRYALYIECDGAIPDGMLDRLDSELSENPHYLYARSLGQLARPRLVRITRQDVAEYHRWAMMSGQRLGDVKLDGLSSNSDWSRIFQYGRDEGGVDGRAVVADHLPGDAFDDPGVFGCVSVVP